MAYLVICAAALYAADRLWQAVRHRRQDTDDSVAREGMSIVIGELDSLFAPGSIQWRVEKQRVSMMRVEVDSGDKPFGYIDLDANKAVIRILPPS